MAEPLTLTLAFPGEHAAFEALALAVVTDPDVADVTLTMCRPDTWRMPRGATVTLTWKGSGVLTLTLPEVLGAGSGIVWRATLSAPGDVAVALARLDAWLSANGDALRLAVAGQLRQPPTVRSAG